MLSLKKGTVKFSHNTPCVLPTPLCHKNNSHLQFLPHLHDILRFTLYGSARMQKIKGELRGANKAEAKAAVAVVRVGVVPVSNFRAAGAVIPRTAT